jgi:hypothetical protein
MHEYDTVLKSLLRDPQNSIFQHVSGARIEQWLNVEFPEVQQTRADMLGLTADRRRLVGVELQSANDIKLPLRMAEYALMSYRLHEMFPEQYVLYVGEAEMRMKSELAGPDFYCRYKIIDIRSLDEEKLLASPFDGDNIMAILTGHGDRRETIRRILARIATLEEGRRDEVFKKLIILAGLRKLRDTILTEVKSMPITEDIMDHDIIGPAIRQGRQEGEQTILRRMIGKRFGSLPPWVDERLTKSSASELEEVSLRFVDAKSIDELFSR